MTPKPRELSDLPTLGSAAELARDRLGLLARAAERGPLVVLPLGAKRAVVVSSAETLQAVLVENSDAFRKTDGYRAAARLLGRGLPQLDGTEHRKQRKLLAPAFGHATIAGYGERMAEAAERVQASWRDGQRIDLCDEIRKLNLGIVASTLLGSDVEAEARELDAALLVVDHFVSRRLGSRLSRLPVWLPLRDNRRARRAIARIDRSIHAAVRRARTRSDKSHDLLALLAAARHDDGSPLTESELRDEALSLLIACQDTTPNALAWSFDLLMRHPSAYAALRSDERYALDVFRETLRLYPPVYVTARQALRDVVIAGVRVPRGSLVFANVYGLHRRPEAFPDPERFDPERWQGDLEKRLPRGSFLPFIDGPRVCIGNQFALLEGQLVLATFARRVVFEPVHAGAREPEPLVTLRPRGGLPVTVRRR